MDTIEDEGFEIRAKSVRKKPISKDSNAESFWADFDLILDVTRMKAENPKWGPCRISKQLSIPVAESKIKKIVEFYFYDEDSNKLFRKGQSLDVPHRPCVTKDELIEMIRKNHQLDHRKSDTIYEDLRRNAYPVVRETIHLLFRSEINCDTCKRAIELPKSTRSRKPIPASYPNSRWQIDLKKMPTNRGFNYVCNIVDCYSRFGFGKATRGKTAKEIANVVLSFIYLFGAPRILQSDNGKEFRNSDLEDVVKEFETKQMHGRPYHPQSQGRVERFNRTMTEYFRVKMADNSNWADQLQEFYYSYNNRMNRATRPSTPYQLYFNRPNFAAPLDDQVPYASLTPEERQFLKEAHLDVDDTSDDDDNDDNGQLTVEVYSNGTASAGDEMTFEDALVHLDREEQSPSMPTLSPAVSLPRSEEDAVASLEKDNSHGTNLLIMTDNSAPTTDLDNVSEYYREIYIRRFGNALLPVLNIYTDAQKENDAEPPAKKRIYEATVDRRKLHNMMYPLEEFAENLHKDVDFYPAVGQNIYYRLNPALNRGTAFFQSGYWKAGRCTSIEKSNCGTVYVVEDNVTGVKYNLNRYQLMKI